MKPPTRRVDLITTPIRLAVIGILALLLAAGFGLTGHAWFSAISALLGLAWLAAELPVRKSNQTPGHAAWLDRLPYGDGWAASLGLPIFCGLAAIAVWLGLPAWLALVVVGLALAGWDLARLAHRLLEAPDAAAANRIERLHLARLGLALGIGLLLGGLALVVHIPLDFGMALVLGGTALVALSLAAREIRKG